MTVNAHQDAASTGPILGLARESGGSLLAVTPAGLFRNPPGGDNLLASVDPGATPVPTAVHVTAVGEIWTGVVGGVLRSRDRGLTWSAHPFRTPAPAVSAITSLADGRILLAGTMADGVLRSDDGGQTWAAWNFGLFDRSALFLAAPGGPAGLVAVASEWGCFTSRNTGKSWTDTEWIPADPITALAGYDEGFLIGDARGSLHRWTPEGAWQAVEDPVAGTAVAGLHVLADGQVVVVDERGGVLLLDRECRLIERAAVTLPDRDIVVSTVAWRDRDHIELAAGCAGGTVRRLRFPTANREARPTPEER